MKLAKAPIMRIFHLSIDAKDHKTFADEGQHNMMISIKNEPGTLLMFAGHDDQLGESNYVIECYQDEEHYQVHANSPQFKHYGQIAKTIITGTKIINLEPELVKAGDTSYRVIGNQDLHAVLTKIKLNKDIDFDKLMNDKDQIILAGRDKQNANEGWILELYPSSKTKSDLTNKVEILKQITLTVDIFVDQGSLDYERSNNND